MLYFSMKHLRKLTLMSGGWQRNVALSSTSRRNTQFVENTPKVEQEDARSLEHNEVMENTPWKKWWTGSIGKHPGKINMEAINLPHRFIEAAKLYLQESDIKVISEVASKLRDLLFSRRTCKHKNIDVKMPFRFNNPKDILNKKHHDSPNVSDSILHSLDAFEKEAKEIDVYQWKQLVYDEYNCAAFLLGRSAATYSASLRVMNEIKKDAPDFAPLSILDFGSGTGTSVWAANTLWQDSLKQYICVDSSKEMNKLAFFIFAGGNYDITLPGLFIRQNLPVSFQNSYDIVTSAYSLSELPSEKERLMLLKLLWEKTERYLILIEQGNFYGYYIMMEARNLLLHGIEGANPKSQKKYSKFSVPASVFAPCPHEKICPMWGTKSSCVFSQKYAVPEYSKIFMKQNHANEKFTYLILEKDGTASKTQTDLWPRVVKNPNLKNCAQCHFCTPAGNIEHISISKSKYGTDFYHLAKKCKLGDRFPIMPKSS